MSGQACGPCMGTEPDPHHKGWHSCDVFVGCDDDCRALQHPRTIEEVAKALDHWENHMYLSGCSHGS